MPKNTLKHSICILLLILIGCKNESKIENGIDKSVSDMWNSYIESNPGFKTEELPESSYFHNNEADANRLADLILKGEKKASSGLYFFYKESNVDLPKIETKFIVTSFDGKALAIIETTKVDTIPFNQITKEYAQLDMGTKIEALKKWKKAHWDFFAKAIEQSGDEPTEEMLIVCEEFKLIWPESMNDNQILQK